MGSRRAASRSFVITLLLRYKIGRCTGHLSRRVQPGSCQPQTCNQRISARRISDFDTRRWIELRGEPFAVAVISDWGVLGYVRSTSKAVLKQMKERAGFQELTAEWSVKRPWMPLRSAPRRVRSL